MIDPSVEKILQTLEFETNRAELAFLRLAATGSVEGTLQDFDTSMAQIRHYIKRLRVEVERPVEK